MIKSKFSCLKLGAVVAVLAITLIPSVRPSTATNQPPVATAASGADLVNLGNEDRSVAKYFDDLFAYHKQSAQLIKKATLVQADVDPIGRKADDLKGRLSGLQNVIRDIVRKLKAANEWNDLDTRVAASITDASKRSFFQQTSFKQLLEESSNNLTSSGNEISIPVDALRKRLTSRYGDGGDFQFVRAAYEAPAPVKLLGLGCRIGLMRIGLIGRLGGNPTDETWDQVECACTGFYNGDVPCTN